jgi:hypothetical protein
MIEVTIGFSDALYICDGVDDQEQFKTALKTLPDTEDLVLRVRPGTYNFNGPDPLYLGRRRVSIIGSGQGTTIIAPTVDSTMGSILNNFIDPVHGLTVNGITFDLSARPDVGAMHIYHGDFVEVANCEFKGQRSVKGMVWLCRFGNYNDPEANVSYNLNFHDNYIHDNDCGSFETLLIANERFPSVINNRFENNKTSAYEIVLYINNHFAVVTGNSFTKSKAKSIAVMESQDTYVANNIAMVDELRFVSIINSQRTTISANTASFSSTLTGDSAGIELFDRMAGPDGHEHIVNPTTNVLIANNTISDFKFGVRMQIVGHLGVDDYELNQSEVQISNNTLSGIKAIPIAIGADHVENTLSHIRVLRNNIVSWNGEYTGAITFRGYKAMPMGGELHVQSNVIAPSSKRNTSGIRLINTNMDTLVNNDVRGTGQVYDPISLVNSTTLRSNGNLP